MVSIINYVSWFQPLCGRMNYIARDSTAVCLPYGIVHMRMEKDPDGSLKIVNIHVQDENSSCQNSQ